MKPPHITLFLFPLLLLPAGVCAQQFEWGHLHGGFSVQWVMPRGDLGTYWQNTLLAGPAAQYEINRDYAAVGIIGLMYFRKISLVGRPSVPDIFLISATGEIQRTVVEGSSARAGVRLGLGNYRFMFRTKEYNNTESEFGAVGSLAVEFSTGFLRGTSLLVQHHVIFASPVWIRIWTAGTTLLIF